MHHFMCLTFSRWPVQWLRLIRPETRGRPTALFERTRNGSVLISCSSEAERLGLYPGQPLADARALAPDVIVEEFALDACQKALEEWCLWCGKFSPLAGVETPRGEPPY